MTPYDHDAAEDSTEPNHEGQAPAGNGLSERGISAMQGTGAEKVNSGQKGSDFERWGRAEVFKGESHRLTALPEDNKHLNKYGDGLGLTKRRSSDSYIDEDGSLWDLKSGYEKGGIDEDQLLEYSMMEDAGRVFIRDANGKKMEVPVTSVNYLFETKAGAAANEIDLRGRATAWYKDENGKVQLYDDEKPSG